MSKREHALHTAFQKLVNQLKGWELQLAFEQDIKAGLIAQAEEALSAHPIPKDA
jgi:hypothetical protein